MCAQDVEAATYLWNIYCRVPSYIGGFPPLSVSVSAHTSMLSQDFPLEVGGLCDSTLTEEGADKKGETVVFHWP